MNNEIELQLLIPKIVIDHNLNLSDLECDEIEQGYFSNAKIVNLLFPLLHSEQKKIFSNTENGRIRRKGSNYFITLKSKMKEDLSRDELEQLISKEDYIRLSREIDAGILKKKRFYMNFHNYNLEIDLITELNHEQFKPEFLTIDIELTDLQQFSDVRKLIAKNSWLKYTSEITGTDLYKYLGMRKLCKFGFNKEIKEATHKIVKEITKIYQQEH